MKLERKLKKNSQSCAGVNKLMNKGLKKMLHHLRFLEKICPKFDQYLIRKYLYQNYNFVKASILPLENLYTKPIHSCHYGRKKEIEVTAM